MLSKYKDNSLDVSQLLTCKICFDRPMFFSAVALNAHIRQYHHADGYSLDSSDDEGTLHEKLILKLEKSKHSLCEQLKSSRKQLLALEKINSAPQTLNLLRNKIENIKTEIVGKNKKIKFLRADNGTPSSLKPLSDRYYENMAQKLVNKNIDDNLARRFKLAKITSTDSDTSTDIDISDTLDVVTKEPRLLNIEKRLEELENELAKRKSMTKVKELPAKQYPNLNTLKATLISNQQKNKLEFDGLIKKTVVNLRHQIEKTKAQFDKNNFRFGNSVDIEEPTHDTNFGSLQSKIEHLTSEQMTLKEINNVFEEELKHAMTQEHRSKKQISRIILEYGRIFNENEQYEKQIQELKKVKEMHSNSISELMNKVQYLESQNKTYEDNLQKLKTRYEKVLEQCDVNESRLKVAKQEYEEKISKLRDHFAAEQEKTVLDTESFIQEIDGKYKEKLEMMEDLLTEEKGDFQRLKADYERSEQERHEKEKQLEENEYKMKYKALENVNLKESEELVFSLKMEKKDLTRMISVISEKFKTAEQQLKEEQRKSLEKIETLNEKIRQLSLEKFNVDRNIERETKQLQKKLDEQIALVVQLKKEKSTIQEKQLKHFQPEKLSDRLRASSIALKVSEDKVAKLTKRLIELERVNCNTAIQNADMVQKICSIQEDLRQCDMEKLTYKKQLQEKSEKIEKLQDRVNNHIQRQISEKKFDTKVLTSTRTPDYMKREKIFNRKMSTETSGYLSEDDRGKSKIHNRKTFGNEESLLGFGRTHVNLETSSVEGISNAYTGQRSLRTENPEMNDRNRESSIANQYAVDSKDILFSPSSQIINAKDSNALSLLKRRLSHNRSSCSTTVFSSPTSPSNHAYIVPSEKHLENVCSEKLAIEDNPTSENIRDRGPMNGINGENISKRAAKMPVSNIKKLSKQNEKVSQNVVEPLNKIEELVTNDQDNSESTNSNILSMADSLAPPNHIEEFDRHNQGIQESIESNLLNIAKSLAPSKNSNEMVRDNQQHIDDSTENNFLNVEGSLAQSCQNEALVRKESSIEGSTVTESNIISIDYSLIPVNNIKELQKKKKSFGESSESDNVTDSSLKSNEIIELLSGDHSIEESIDENQSSDSRELVFPSIEAKEYLNNGESRYATLPDKDKDFIKEDQNKEEDSDTKHQNVITENVRKSANGNKQGECSGYKNLIIEKPLAASTPRGTNKFFAGITSLSNRTNGLLTLGTLPLLQQSFTLLMNNGNDKKEKITEIETEEDEDTSFSIGESDPLLSELENYSEESSF